MSEHAAFQQPCVSVVIPTRNRAGYLREALDAIRSGALQSYEVLVMDQTDGDSTQQVVAQFEDARLRYHRMPRNGACPARNLGAALATADLVVFLDDDCCPRPDWLARIVAAFEGDPGLQFIFGQLKAPDEDRMLGWYPEFIPDPSLNEGKARRKIATLGAGANMSARKAFLRRIGGFDEPLGPRDVSVNSSDSSMNYKVLRSGEKWLASAEIEVVHKNGFRRHDELARLFGAYAREMGIGYGRFVRRGDSYAAWLFFIEHCEFAYGAVKDVLRRRRPYGIRDLVWRTRGFVEGLRLPGSVGYVDGAEFQRMEQTGKLDT